MIRTPRFLQIVGVNSVPVAGVFWAEWAAATALALYWCESVMIILLVGFRIWLHRRATNKRGHLDGSALGADKNSARTDSTFLHAFLTTALVFTGAHAVFLAVILFLMLPQNFPEVGGVDFTALRQGILVVAAILAVGLVIDVIRIRDRSFYWIRQMAGRVMGRVILVHLTIILGMFATAWLGGPRGIFIVFAGFKLIADIGTFLVSDDLPDPEASGWWLATLRSIGGDKWADGWAALKREVAEEERSRAANWERSIGT